MASKKLITYRCNTTYDEDEDHDAILQSLCPCLEECYIRTIEVKNCCGGVDETIEVDADCFARCWSERWAKHYGGDYGDDDWESLARCRQEYEEDYCEYDEGYRCHEPPSWAEALMEEEEKDNYDELAERYGLPKEDLCFGSLEDAEKFIKSFLAKHRK